MYILVDSIDSKCLAQATRANVIQLYDIMAVCILVFIYKIVDLQLYSRLFSVELYYL
jgi:hypothetical protein